MEADISKQIAELPSFTRQQLLDLWLELHGRAAPPGIRRELMIPFLAYRMQEKAYGGLKPSTRAELRRIARALEGGPDLAKRAPQFRMKSGTRIVRQWQGKKHEVSVTDSGFEYGGAAFQSLSQIARKITGTRWSGPAFFGLRNSASAGNGSDD